METQLAFPPSPRKVKVTGGYVDLLAERRDTSDLRWAIREWQSRGDYRYGSHMTRKDIFDHVLQSDRVGHTIAKVGCILVTYISSYSFQLSLYLKYSVFPFSPFKFFCHILWGFLSVHSFSFQTFPLIFIPICFWGIFFFVYSFLVHELSLFTYYYKVRQCEPVMITLLAINYKDG